MALCALALVLWWGVSAHFAIPLVWLLGIARCRRCSPTGPRLWVDRRHARGRGRSRSSTSSLVGCVGVAVWRLERRFRAQAGADPGAQRVPRAPPQLPAPIGARGASPTRWTPSCCAGASTSPASPTTASTGFDWGEQFHGGTQLRYQLNSLAWALSLFAANYVPNAPGQIERALRRVVLKHTDLRVWQYWRTLNLARQLRPEPRPDRPRQHHVLGVPRRRAEHLRGGDRLDPLRRAGLADVRVEGRADVRLRPPLDRRPPCGPTSSAAASASSRASRAGRSPCATSWARRRCAATTPLHGTDDWDGSATAGGRRSTRSTSRPTARYAHIRSQPRRPVVGHRRGAGRPLLRQRHAPLRRHPPGARPAGEGPRPAQCRRRRWPPSPTMVERRPARPSSCPPSRSATTPGAARCCRGTR